MERRHITAVLLCIIIISAAYFSPKDKVESVLPIATAIPTEVHETQTRSKFSKEYVPSIDIWGEINTMLDPLVIVSQAPNSYLLTSFNSGCAGDYRSLREYSFIGENTAKNKVARQAYIVVDQLSKGFWCSWNYSPMHNKQSLFDKTLFSENPAPDGTVLRNVWNALYWCTFLPVHANADVVHDAADKMEIVFAADHPDRYVLGKDSYVDASGDSNIYPGATAFIHAPKWCETTRRNVCHVGIVYDVTAKGVVVIQSNAEEKAILYPINNDGSVGVGYDGSYIVSHGNPAQP